MADRRQLSKESTEDLLEAMLKVARTVNHVLETRAVEVANEPLTHSQVQILVLLGEQGEQNPSRIAPFLGVTRPAITQIVSSMVKSKLVQRISRGGDRRGIKIHLTARGRRVLEKIRLEQRHLTLAAFSRSKGKHRQAWAEALTEVSRALAQADNTFSRFCHECGAYEDGSCVLVGGNASCRYLQSQKGTLTRGKRKTSRTKRGKG